MTEQQNICHIIGTIGKINHDSYCDKTMITAQVMTSRIYKNPDNSLTEECTWHTVKAWNNKKILKETLDTLKTGSYIDLTGTLLSEETTNANKRHELRTYIKAETLSVLNEHVERQYLNEIILTGAVGTSITSKTGPVKLSQFTLGTHIIYKDMHNRTMLNSTWHSIKAYSSQNISDETLSKIVKGSNLTVKGRIRHDRYTAKYGEDKIMTSIIAEYIEPEN